MKRVLFGFLASASMSLVFSLTAFADPRSDAIDAAQDLATGTAELSNYVMNTCGCQNTARVLSKMSDRAGALELTTRFGTRQESIHDLRPVVQSAIEIRQFVAHIGDPVVKLHVKRTYLNLLNTAGKAIDPKWVLVACKMSFSAADASCSEDSLLEQSDSNLDRNVQPKNYDSIPQF